MNIEFKMNLKNIVIAEIAVVALVLLFIRPMIFGSMKRVIIEKEGVVEEIERKLGETSAELTPEEQDKKKKNLEKNIKIHNQILASLEQAKEKLGSTIIKDTDVPVVVEKITKLTQGVGGVELVAIKPDIVQAGDEDMGFVGDFGPPDGMGEMGDQNLAPKTQAEELNINIEVKSKYKDLIDYFEKLSAFPMAFYVKSLEITQDLDEIAPADDSMARGFDWPPEGNSSAIRRPAAKPVKTTKFESKALSINLVLTTILTK